MSWLEFGHCGWHSHTLLDSSALLAGWQCVLHGHGCSPQPHERVPQMKRGKLPSTANNWKLKNKPGTIRTHPDIRSTMFHIRCLQFSSSGWGPNNPPKELRFVEMPPVIVSHGSAQNSWGEPLGNPKLFDALRILSAPELFGLSARRCGTNLTIRC